ncbi:MAG: hypothetical protein ACI8U4_001035 [Natronomonas sp.]|jgi:hypothetical protein
MQPFEPHDAPLVPESSTTETPTIYADGGDQPERRPFDRPPRTDYAAPTTRHREEIEPGAADLR